MVERYTIVLLVMKAEERKLTKENRVSADTLC